LDSFKVSIPDILKVPERGSTAPSLIGSAAWPEMGNEARRRIAKRTRDIEDIFSSSYPPYYFIELNVLSLYL
jgi:hypothetical protein